jgi:hypothetical protein
LAWGDRRCSPVPGPRTWWHLTCAPAGVRRAFGERVPRDRGLCRRTARLPDRGNVEDMLAGTTALLATTGTRRIADDGESATRSSKIKLRKIKIYALTP